MSAADPAVTPAGDDVIALELRGIEKRFGSLQAVASLNLGFRRGEVHAVLGENGAGKSTLMNITAGFLTPDAGAILVGGELVQFGSPGDALAHGVGMVHQHFRLVEQFTVAENLAIGAADVPAVTSHDDLVARARRLEAQFGLSIDPDRPVWTLSVGEKQRVEITRTLSRGARVLILDEPTAVLTPDETEQLCATLRAMAVDGTTVIFISHKLNEALAVADRISVMRRGELVATRDRAECDLEVLAKLMFGEFLGEDRAKRRTLDPESPVIVALNGVSARDDRGVAALRDVSLNVRAGEILGVVGVAGNGQQELEEVVSGLRGTEAGEIVIKGRVARNVRAFLDARVAHIPEDRLGMGLVSGASIWRNAILRRYRHRPIALGPLIQGRSARRFAGDLARSVNLSTHDVTVPVRTLSGGNAQKLLAGRELQGDRSAVVAVNPTQGLDIQAAAAVRSALLEASSRGLAVLLISADLDEVLQLADRVLVLYEGAIAGEFDGAAIDRDAIGMLMGGGTLAEVDGA
jgi:simple sugar transport system ATP-binding protein